MLKELDLSNAPFSEEQCEWLQQQLGRWAKVPPASDGTEQSAPSASGSAPSTATGKPWGVVTRNSYHCNSG